MKKRALITILLFLVLACFVLAETETPIGTFNVGNTPPPTPTNWTPTDTHNKSQIFTWSEGTDDNGDPISTYICITNDTDTDSCSVVNTGPNATPQYAFQQTEPNWDFDWGTASRNYYVKLTPYDGIENGTPNNTISFTLTDYLPVVSGQTSDASNDGDKDVGETITFQTSYTDNESDPVLIRVCTTNSINTDGTCTASQYCGNATYSTNTPRTCTYTAQQTDSTSNTAYFFVCDCAPNDNTCPSQCSSSASHTFYVNHAPNATNVDVIPDNPKTTNDLTCNYTFSDSDGDSDSSTFRWFNYSGGSWIDTGLTTQTISSSNTNKGETWKCEVTPKDEHNFEGTSVNSTNETIQNTPPNQPNNFRVQDGAASYDSTHPIDTHDSTPYIDWNATDDDDDTITMYICVASTAAKRDADDCHISLNTTTNSNFTLSELAYNGTSEDYFLRLTPNDGTVNGTSLDTNFSLINSIPNQPSALSPNTTHNQTPTLSWTATDDDDGSVDHWPADSLTYHIKVGTSYGDGTYEDNNNADKTAETVDNPIPWGTPGPVWANNTVYASIWTTDGHTGGTSPFYNTTLILYDFLPDIMDVEMTNIGSSYSSCGVNALECALYPVEHSNTTVAVRITANDTDDDCDVGGNSQAYIDLCLNTTTCDPTTGDYDWQVDNIQRTGSTCTYTFTTNKTASDGTPEFFRLPNSSYKLYANVSSQAGQRTTDNERILNWTYGTLKAIDYPPNVTLGGGNPTLGQWNNGTDLALMTNWGNDNLNLQWNTTDPTNGVDTWDLNGSDMQIDDDNVYNDETSGYLSPVFLNGTSNIFEPGTGLEVCSAFDCNDPNLNETLDTYYHINPPLGLSSGTYNSTITITIS